MASQTCASALRLLRWIDAVVAKGVEVVEQSGVAVAIAELEVVADAGGFVEVASLVAIAPGAAAVSSARHA